jgi:hypothetical protein
MKNTKDLEGNYYDLFQGSIPSFARATAETEEQALVTIVDIPSNIQTR